MRAAIPDWIDDDHPVLEDYKAALVLPTIGVFWYRGLEASISYNRLSVYQSDVASQASSHSEYAVRLGGRVTLELSPARGQSIHLSAAGGYERRQDIAATGFKRCTTLPSQDPDVTGTACSDAYYLDQTPEAKSQLYASLAGVYVHKVTPGSKQPIPGMELRFDAQGTRDTAAVDSTLMFFLVPISNSTAVRTGVGATLRTALAAPDDADYEAGDISGVDVFGFVGMTF